MLYILAQPAEPSPQGWAATGEKIVGLASKEPDAFWPIVAVALPLLTVAAMVLLVVKWVLPAWDKWVLAWREEKRLDRDSLVAALRQRGEEAERDASKDREVNRAQNEMIVNRVEGKIDRITGEFTRLSDRMERQGEILSRIASKIGAVAAVALAFLSGAAAGAGWTALADRPESHVDGTPAACSAPAEKQPLQASEESKAPDCPKPCNVGQYCCGQQRCCEQKSDTATTKPLSAVGVVSMTGVAVNYCDFRRMWCR